MSVGHACRQVSLLPVLLLTAGLAATPKPAPEPPVVVLPPLTVVGHQIPTSWLEVSWVCKTELPFSLVKRAWISKVGWGTPADKAGIKRGDLLLAIDGAAVGDMGGERLHALLQLEREAGTRLELTIQTPGHEKRTVPILYESSAAK